MKELKQLHLDCNNNLEGDPCKPLISFDMIFHRNLSVGEVVQVIQGDDSWIGEVLHVKSGEETYWYASINPTSWEDLSFQVFPAFKRMDHQQAEQHFEWFMNNKQQTLEIFSNTYHHHGGYLSLDFTPASLEGVWTWFTRKMNEIREYYDQDVPQHWKRNDMNITNTAEWTRHMIGTRSADYSFGMFEMVMDVGIYFGEVCIRNLKGLDWAYHNSPSSKDSKKPLLIGETLLMNPFRLVYSLEKRKENTLIDEYRAWERANEQLAAAQIDEMA